MDLFLFFQGYVSCSWGISNIGYVLICYGVTNSVASFSTGYLVKLTGRFFMVLSATAIQIGIMVTLYVWTPDPANSSVIFFVVSGLWGVTDAVWLVQINCECLDRIIDFTGSTGWMPFLPLETQTHYKLSHRACYHLRSQLF
jgi:predicted MFS family arabinose efflux permease